MRTLHHNDQLKLLSPAHRSERGYRLYSRHDLGRVERIVVLRFLGLSLREIGGLLNSPGRRGSERLSVALARQGSVVRERRDALDRVLRAIEHAQMRARDSAEPEWHLYQTILKELHMQEVTDWREKYYDPKALKKLRCQQAAMKPEQKVEIGARWRTLLADVQSALDRAVSPDTAEGRALVARWMRLADEHTLGDPEIAEGYRRLYEDENHWPNDVVAAQLRAMRPKSEHRAFFKQAVQACLRHG